LIELQGDFISMISAIQQAVPQTTTTTTTTDPTPTPDLPPAPPTPTPDNGGVQPVLGDWKKSFGHKLALRESQYGLKTLTWGVDIKDSDHSREEVEAAILKAVNDNRDLMKSENFDSIKQINEMDAVGLIISKIPGGTESGGIWGVHYTGVNKDSKAYNSQTAKFNNFKFAQGGYLSGKSHEMGGIPIEAEGGEYIINKNAVEKLGVPYLNYLNEEGDLPFMKFGMSDFMRQDTEVGISEVRTDSEDVKVLIKELIQAIQDGDKSVVDALDELELSPEVNVFTDLDKNIESQVEAFRMSLRDHARRGKNLRDL
jgi:hypothetical protein